MTLALLMFIYGMGRYFKRIYQRFALDSDHYITGKFEFGDSAHEAQSTVTQPADPGLGEVLSGGIAALPAASASAERQRTKEAQRIIGLVEPQAPTMSQRAGAGGAAAHATAAAGGGGGGPAVGMGGGGGGGGPNNNKDCIVS